MLKEIKYEKDAIENICNSTELKEVEFDTMFIEKEELLKLNINNLIQKLTINFNHIENIYKYIMEKFPNISELFISISLCRGDTLKQLIIEENSNSKINKINIIIQESAIFGGINIICGPFEKLENFSLFIKENNSINIKDSSCYF